MEIIKSVKVPICLSEQLKEYCRLCFLAYDTYYNLAIAKINEIESDEEREYMKKIIANFMKMSYLNWNRDTVDDEVIGTYKF